MARRKRFTPREVKLKLDKEQKVFRNAALRNLTPIRKAHHKRLKERIFTDFRSAKYHKDKSKIFKGTPDDFIKTGMIAKLFDYQHAVRIGSKLQGAFPILRRVDRGQYKVDYTNTMYKSSARPQVVHTDRVSWAIRRKRQYGQVRTEHGRPARLIKKNMIPIWEKLVEMRDKKMDKILLNMPAMGNILSNTISGSIIPPNRVV